jgi:hypothetical protein
MNKAFKSLGWALTWALAAGGTARSQDAPAAAPRPAPAKSSAQIDAGEPRANTSAPSPEPAAAAKPAAATAAPPTGAPPAAAPPRGQSAAAARAAAAPAAGAATPAAGASPRGQKASGAADRLNLGTATVTGDREQPKVMYIVPWKSSNIGDLSGKPMNSLLDEALAPVDRDEFKREVAYFDAVNAPPENGAAGPAAKQGEK